MTKSELKSIIAECYDEVLDEKIVKESAEIEAYLEAVSNDDNMDIETLVEGANMDNIKEATSAIKAAKKSMREAKKLIKEGKNKEAKDMLKASVKDLKKAQKDINDNDKNAIAPAIILGLIIGLIGMCIAFLIQFVTVTKSLNKSQKDGLISGWKTEFNAKKILKNEIPISFNLKKNTNYGGTWKGVFDSTTHLYTAAAKAEMASDKGAKCGTIAYIGSSFIALLATGLEMEQYRKKYDKKEVNIVSMKLDKVLDKTIKNIEKMITVIE